MRKGEAATISYIQANLNLCMSKITVVVREKKWADAEELTVHT
jgi:hypothetical protein